MKSSGWEPVGHLQGSLGPSGPETPKKSEKNLPEPPAPGLLKPVLQWVTALSGTLCCTQKACFLSCTSLSHEHRFYDSRFWFHCSETHLWFTNPIFFKYSPYIWCHLFLFGIGMWFGFLAFFKSCDVLWTMINIRSLFRMDGMWISDPIQNICCCLFGFVGDVVQAQLWSQTWIWHINLKEGVWFCLLWLLRTS